METRTRPTWRDCRRREQTEVDMTNVVLVPPSRPPAVALDLEDDADDRRKLITLLVGRVLAPVGNVVGVATGKAQRAKGGA